MRTSSIPLLLAAILTTAAAQELPKPTPVSPPPIAPAPGVLPPDAPAPVAPIPLVIPSVAPAPVVPAPAIRALPKVGVPSTTPPSADAGGSSDQFLNAYLAFQKAEMAEGKGNYRDAISGYSETARQLDELRALWPNWNPAIVTHRRDKASEGIERLRTKLTQEPIAPGGVEESPLRGPAAGAPVPPLLPPLLPPDTDRHVLEPIPASSPEPATRPGSPARIPSNQKLNYDADPFKPFKAQVAAQKPPKSQGQPFAVNQQPANRGKEIIREAKLKVLQRHYEETLNDSIELEKKALSSGPGEKEKLEAQVQALKEFLLRLETDLQSLADQPVTSRTPAKVSHDHGKFENRAGSLDIEMRELPPTATEPKASQPARVVKPRKEILEFDSFDHGHATDAPDTQLASPTLESAITTPRPAAEQR